MCPTYVSYMSMCSPQKKKCVAKNVSLKKRVAKKYALKT